MKFFIILLGLLASSTQATPLLKLRTRTLDITQSAKLVKIATSSQEGDFIIQYRNPISDLQRQNLSAVAEILGYLPDFALVVHGPLLSLKQLQHDDADIYGIEVTHGINAPQRRSGRVVARRETRRSC